MRKSRSGIENLMNDVVAVATSCEHANRRCRSDYQPMNVVRMTEGTSAIWKLLGATVHIERVVGEMVLEMDHKLFGRQEGYILLAWTASSYTLILLVVLVRFRPLALNCESGQVGFPISLCAGFPCLENTSPRVAVRSLCLKRF